jgi:hypothetical protein
MLKELLKIKNLHIIITIANIIIFHVNNVLQIFLRRWAETFLCKKRTACDDSAMIHTLSRKINAATLNIWTSLFVLYIIHESPTISVFALVYTVQYTKLRIYMKNFDVDCMMCWFSIRCIYRRIQSPCDVKFFTSRREKVMFSNSLFRRRSLPNHPHHWLVVASCPALRYYHTHSARPPSSPPLYPWPTPPSSPLRVKQSCTKIIFKRNETNITWPLGLRFVKTMKKK